MKDKLNLGIDSSIVLLSKEQKKEKYIMNYMKNTLKLKTLILMKNYYQTDIVIQKEKKNIQKITDNDLLSLEFKNSTELQEIILSNTFREIYIKNGISYNKYNSYSIDFESIDKIFTEKLIENKVILETNDIIEMQFINEDFLNDHVLEYNYKINLSSLRNDDKKDLIAFYEKRLKDNEDACLKINERLKNIIAYITKHKNIAFDESIKSIINKGKINANFSDIFKEFLNQNNNLSINNLSNLMLYFGRL